VKKKENLSRSVLLKMTAMDDCFLVMLKAFVNWGGLFL